MKITINKTGELIIDGRAKLCPYDQPYPGIPKVPCGDWCALAHVHIGDEAMFFLQCGGREWGCLLLDFTDERAKK